MRKSQYAQAVPAIIAAMEKERGEDGTLPRQEENEQDIMHIYPLEGGGVVITRTPIEDEIQSPIIDSQVPETDTRHTTPKDPPYFLHFLLMLLLFVGLDSADTMLTALFTPTATITLIPKVQTVTIRSSVTLGKLLPPLTLTESQTVPTTGHGHQDARAAGGTLTFYNAAFTTQTVAAGAVFMGRDGVQVVTDAPVTIAANNPPNDGVADVLAHAVQTGTQGNIQALDINGTFATALYVKNLTPFRNGQDEREYMVVAQADTDTAAEALSAKVRESMAAALQGQVSQGEQVQAVPCTPLVTANHHFGDEATNVTVTVSETCTAIAYNTEELQKSAMQLLTTQAAKIVGKDYTLAGNITVTVMKATAQTPTVFLSFTARGTWVYQINQAKVTRLVMGRRRLAALHVLSTNPGIKEATIEGVSDNQELPSEADHLRIIILVFAQ